jgi:hypothetical protein
LLEPAAGTSTSIQAIDVVPAQAAASEGGETPLADPGSRRRGKRAQAKPQRTPDAVIPLVHAPDDPGPEIVEEPEPVPEPPQDGWRKVFK